MERSTRRAIERSIRNLMRKSGDNCSICGVAFPHNSRTFGGLTANEAVALAGECCASKIAQVVVSGVFVTRHQEAFFQMPRTKGAPETTQDVNSAANKLQSFFSDLDQVASRIGKRAGVRSSNASLNTTESPWKEDDAEWFRRNTTRSHRFRPMFEGERATFPLGALAPEPADHTYQILVRQVEPGQRLRIPFCRNTTVPIPDSEPVLHALFDVMSNGAGPRVISAAEVVAIATQYALTKSNDG
jgi:hypothetical protein